MQFRIVFFLSLYLQLRSSSSAPRVLIELLHAAVSDGRVTYIIQYCARLSEGGFEFFSTFVQFIVVRFTGISIVKTM